MFALADQPEVRLAKARGTSAMKIDTSPLILSPFEAERKARARVRTPSLPARPGVTLSFLKNRRARRKGASPSGGHSMIRSDQK